ncbi:MAG TPA: hypothetical protein VEC15_11000, partial [Actinomycetota bacterium]|nr:hypothetical protein [Actinomycetota bacterium]
HEALANTQSELLAARRRADEAASRVRELERELADAFRAAASDEPPIREPAPVPDYVTAASAEPAPMSSFAARISGLRREIASHVEEVAGVAHDDAAGDEEPELTLRERLARAAAARHRPSGVE